MAYIALENVRHNGKEFKKGDEVTGLKKEEATRLLELKVVEEESKAPAKSEAKD